MLKVQEARRGQTGQVEGDTVRFGKGGSGGLGSSVDEGQSLSDHSGRVRDIRVWGSDHEIVECVAVLVRVNLGRGMMPGNCHGGSE